MKPNAWHSVPETMLPVQFFVRTAASDTPEKRLMFAVLLDAIVQLRRGDGTDATDAASWIREENADTPVTFSQACDALGFEPRSLARGILSWRGDCEAGSKLGARPLPRSQRRVTPQVRSRPLG